MKCLGKLPERKGKGGADEVGAYERVAFKKP